MDDIKTDWSEFLASLGASRASADGPSDSHLVTSFGDVAAEYRALVDGPALVDRSDRVILEATGADRVSWLHNLTTNHVKGLASGEGHYGFALNLKGRILFDLNILVRDESIWIDLDRRFLEVATSHLNKYTVSEDVVLSVFSDRFVRLGLAGERSKDLARDLGVTNAAALPWYAMAEGQWNGKPLTLFRHDFCGTFGLEMLIPVEWARDFWKWLSSSDRPTPAIPVGLQAVDVCRIEAGIPWPGREITDANLSAETRQLDRAVSFQKGCYLGQEVVERMRSRRVVAKQLVGLRLEGDACPMAPVELQLADGTVVGTMTSVCRSFACGAIIGLGYIKTAHLAGGATFKAVWNETTAGVTVAELPFRPCTSQKDEKAEAK